MAQPNEPRTAAIRAQAFRDAAEMVEQIKPESSNPNGRRALEAYQLTIATALRITAKLTVAAPVEVQS